MCGLYFFNDFKRFTKKKLYNNEHQAYISFLQKIMMSSILRVGSHGVKGHGAIWPRVAPRNVVKMKF